MLFDELKIFSRHGRQYVRDLRKSTILGPFRGFPKVAPDITEKEALEAAAVCPTGAIGTTPFSIDLGKCIFCSECEFLIPGKIQFTAECRLASNSRENLIVMAGDQGPVQLDEDLIRNEVRSMFKQALKLRQVSAGGDNANEMELNAAGNVNFDMGRYGIEFVASPRHADGLVITGPISENMAEALEICYEATPSPKIIILVGTDAISGGIFEGSKAVDRSFIDKYPVDLYVPGNPAHPLSFINGVLDLVGRK